MRRSISTARLPACPRPHGTRSADVAELRMVRLLTAREPVRGPRHRRPARAPRASSGSSGRRRRAVYPMGAGRGARRRRGARVRPRSSLLRRRRRVVVRRAAPTDAADRPLALAARWVAAARARRRGRRRRLLSRAIWLLVGASCSSALAGAGAAGRERPRRRCAGRRGGRSDAAQHGDLEVVGARGCGRARRARRPRSEGVGQVRLVPPSPTPAARRFVGLAAEHAEAAARRSRCRRRGCGTAGPAVLVAVRRPTSATRISTSIGLISWVKTWPRIWAYSLARLRASTSSRLNW